MISSWRQRLFEAADIRPLVTLRVAFGLMMVAAVVRSYWMGFVEAQYLQPDFHFNYYGWEWVKPLPAFGIHAVMALMAVSALGIALGAFYRWSCAVFLLTFSYIELLDAAYYLNHYYFVSLMAFTLLILPAHRAFSVDVKWRRVNAAGCVPFWMRALPAFWLGMVYFYAGLAKTNADWLLHGLPLRIWLPAFSHWPVVGSWMTKPETALVFSWAGMLFDVSIPFLLLNKRIRPLAYLMLLAFHLLTGLMFPIGIFPVVMSISALVFFSDQFHARIWQWHGVKPAELALQHRYLFRFTHLLILFQLVWPWRYLAYPGPLFWKEEGYRFSWRVMLMEKAGTAQFYIRDPKSGKEWQVRNRDYLNDTQEKQMSFQPDLLLQFAHYLGKRHLLPDGSTPIVRAEVWVTLNGRRGQLLFSPHLNLMNLRDSFAPKSWLNPWNPNF